MKLSEVDWHVGEAVRHVDDDREGVLIDSHGFFARVRFNGEGHLTTVPPKKLELLVK